MRLGAVLILASLLAAPLSAQRRIDLIVDIEGVRQTTDVQFEPNTVRYEPRFDNGGGVGGGVNFFFSPRVSLEMKAAGLASKLTVRRSGPDFVAIVDVGNAQIYPITAILQWHVTEKGAIRPYLGVGAGYIILRNVEKRVIGATAIEFDNPTGLVVDAGVLIPISKRFSVTADARYTPIETETDVRFIGTTSAARIQVRPLIVSFGLAYSF